MSVLPTGLGPPGYDTSTPAPEADDPNQDDIVEAARSRTWFPPRSRAVDGRSTLGPAGTT